MVHVHALAMCPTYDWTATGYWRLNDINEVRREDSFLVDVTPHHPLLIDLLQQDNHISCLEQQNNAHSAPLAIYIQ